MQLFFVVTGAVFVSTTVKFASGLLTGSGIHMPALEHLLDMAIKFTEAIPAVILAGPVTTVAIVMWQAHDAIRSAGAQPPSFAEILSSSL